MGLAERIELYRQLESKRHKPLIVYVTSPRPYADGQISQDAIAELLTQLHKLPDGTQDIDLLLVSQGGDPTVAWRIVSLIRERTDKFSVLVPQSAYSAGTLIALGANEIVMHPNGNLGPTDPQITNQQKGIRFGSEDIHAFLRFVRNDVGLTDQKPIRDLFQKFSEEVGFMGVAVAARGSQLSKTMGEKMLKLHMLDTAELTQTASAISNALNTKYFHHGYPLSRTEAKQVGLSVAASDSETESIMWSIWQDIEIELKVREPFLEMELFRNDQNCSNLFAPVPQFSLPPGSSTQQQQMLFQMYMQFATGFMVPPTAFSYVTALMESIHHASQQKVSGSVVGARQLDLTVRTMRLPEKMGWEDIPTPTMNSGS